MTVRALLVLSVLLAGAGVWRPAAARRVTVPRDVKCECGEARCAGRGQCPAGKPCTTAADCKSGICNDTTKTCAVPACDDRVKNGSETDIDCGGECSRCVNGAACTNNADCKSENCRYSRECSGDQDCAGSAAGPWCSSGKVWARSCSCRDSRDCKTSPYTSCEALPPLAGVSLSVCQKPCPPPCTTDRKPPSEEWYWCADPSSISPEQAQLEKDLARAIQAGGKATLFAWVCGLLLFSIPIVLGLLIPRPGWASTILSSVGVLCLVSSFLRLPGSVLFALAGGLAGVVAGIRGLRRGRDPEPPPRGGAILGLVLGLLVLILAGLMLVFSYLISGVLPAR